MVVHLYLEILRQDYLFQMEYFFIILVPVYILENLCIDIYKNVFF